MFELMHQVRRSSQKFANPWSKKKEKVLGMFCQVWMLIHLFLTTLTRYACLHSPHLKKLQGIKFPVLQDKCQAKALYQAMLVYTTARLMPIKVKTPLKKAKVPWNSLKLTLYVSCNADISKIFLKAQAQWTEDGTMKQNCNFRHKTTISSHNSFTEFK